MITLYRSSLLDSSSVLPPSLRSEAHLYSPYRRSRLDSPRPLCNLLPHCTRSKAHLCVGVVHHQQQRPARALDAIAAALAIKVGW